MSEEICGWVSKIQEFFNRATSALEEADSDFTPAEGMYSVANQVAHVADTIHWFIDGGLEFKPFDMTFEAHDERVRKITSLTEARAKLDEAFDRLQKIVSGYSPEDLMATIPADSAIMAGMPRTATLSGIDEHTAHHRGSLAVYARLLGKVPPMPYM